MTAIAAPYTGTLTLSQRLSEGTIPAGQALRYATMIAEALRNLHDSGKIHGRLSPSAIIITETGLEVLAAPEEDDVLYAAPEVLAGQAADVRSDVFSYGAVLYAMLTGHSPYDGGAAATASGATLPAAGSPMDRLLSQCMAKIPAARLQRMQRVLLELKFLTVAARRSESQLVASAVQSELQRKLDGLTQRLTAAELEIEVLRHYSASLEENLQVGLRSHERTLEEHTAAIDSAQIVTEQTDNLLERVMDTLELLQSSMLNEVKIVEAGVN